MLHGPYVDPNRNGARREARKEGKLGSNMPRRPPTTHPLSDLFIRAIRPQPTAVEYWDRTQTGLVLRCSPSGRLTWFARARTAEGKRTRPKLGQWPELSLAQARKMAAGIIVDIARGRDPVAEKRRARTERLALAGRRTVGEAMDDWQTARQRDPEKPWSHAHARNIQSAVKCHVSDKVRSRALVDMKRGDWMAIVARVAKHAPAAGAHLYTTVSAFLTHAEAMGWIENHPLPRGGRRVVAPHVAARQRVLSDAEWVAIWKASEAEPPKLRVFARLLILSLARTSEVASIRVSSVSPTRSHWSLPGFRTKNGNPHVMPLCDLARAELNLVWPLGAREATDDPFLLGRAGHAPFTGLGKLLTRLKQRTGIHDWTWHDLRRTGRTTFSFLGVDERLAEAALNHVAPRPHGTRNKIIGVYDIADDAPLAIKALGIWQGYVGEVLAGKLAPETAEHRFRDQNTYAIPVIRISKNSPRQKAKPGRKPTIAVPSPVRLKQRILVE